MSNKYFFRGGLSAFVLVPKTVESKDRASSDDKSDVQRLRGDWLNVAGDLSLGMKRYEQRQKKSA